ncbi:MAG: helix-turn-helix transcriptional regulator [Clostridia bacterium]|nr:helix-turn-helix transcriptional regulator [Clostridia bacterium]
MKIHAFSEFNLMDPDVRITDIFPEQWKTGREFSLYRDRPRPVSAFFFVCSELSVLFRSEDDGSTLTAQQGDVVFIPQGIRYSAHAEGNIDEKTVTYTVNLHLLDTDREEFLCSDRISVLTHRKDQVHTRYLERLSDAFHRSSESRSMAKIKGEFFLLLDLLLSTSHEGESFYYPIRKGAEAFCAEWNKNEKIEKYAQMSEVSVTYFYRCFRKWSGKSPVEYRNSLRLSHAESLLRCTNMRILEIAQAVGFDDPLYFCRIFSDAYGLSPHHYRKSHQVEG